MPKIKLINVKTLSDFFFFFFFFFFFLTSGFLTFMLVTLFALICTTDARVGC